MPRDSGDSGAAKQTGQAWSWIALKEIAIKKHQKYGLFRFILYNDLA